MVGSAVATMVWLSALRNIASARPPIMATTSRRPSLRSAGGAETLSPTACRCDSGAVAAVRCGAVIDTRRAPGRKIRPALRGACGCARESLLVSHAGRLFGRVLRGCAQRPVQGLFLDEEDAGARNAEADRRRDEHPMEGGRETAMTCGQRFERRRRRSLPHAAQHDRAEDCDHDSAAERPEKIQRAGCSAKLMRLDGVLHDDGADRIHRAQAEAENKQERYDLGEAMLRRV